MTEKKKKKKKKKTHTKHSELGQAGAAGFVEMRLFFGPCFFFFLFSSF